MSNVIKFEDLPQEKQDAINKLKKKFFWKSLLTGANFGAMLFFVNLIIALAKLTFQLTDGSTILISIVVNFSIIIWFQSTLKDNAVKVREEFFKILEK